MRCGHLFAGIGGFMIPAQMMGWKNLWWNENDPFAAAVLRYHFPEAEAYETDIQKLPVSALSRVDLLTGGFPCQPVSGAGSKKGFEDSRWLWPEMYRAIRALAPRWVLPENVRELLNTGGGVLFETVSADLEAAGYQILPLILPAAGVDAPHRRYRVFPVAYADGIGLEDSGPQPGGYSRSARVDPEPPLPHPDRHGRQGRFDEQPSPGNSPGRTGTASCPGWDGDPPEPVFHGLDDGLSARLVSYSVPGWRNRALKAYGNAVVPALILEIYRAIARFESQLQSTP